MGGSGQYRGVTTAHLEDLAEQGAGAMTGLSLFATATADGWQPPLE
jgi:hypothetical protein